MADAQYKTLLLPEYRYEKQLKRGDRVLLELSLNYPRPAGSGRGFRRLERYFSALAEGWRRRWEGPLLRQAEQAEEVASRPWVCSLDCRLTRLDDRFLSLWWEVREDVGGPRPRRLREGEVWQLPDGQPLTLAQLMGGPGWRRRVLAQVSHQIQGQLEAGEALYHQDWPRLLRRHLSPHRCFLTEQGPQVFFPICSIAPALEDFPTFPLTPAP